MDSVLSSDIQQALQHAVGEANNAFPATDKKKRNRDKGDDSGSKKKKKKSKEPEQQQQDSTNAFISALIAAASATSEQQPQPQQQQYSPHQFYPYQPAVYPVSYPVQQQSSVVPQDISNDDILRSVQEVDIAKITTVLKTLTDAASAYMMPLPSPPQLPFTSVATKKVNTKATDSHKRTLNMSLPGPEQNTNPQHAYILATKWMNAAKLAEMVKTDGLVYKKGKFSAIEEQQLKDAIEGYRIKNGLTEEGLNELIFAKNEKGKESTFWSEITAAVPQRPIIAVYHHIRRTYHPMKQQGKWMPAEDEKLKRAVTEYGQQWEKISLEVGRMSADCRDRYRNHIVHREIRVNGAWSKEEEEELTRIVTEMTIQLGKDPDNDVFWGQVSERMGNRRGRQQCRIKWTDSLSKLVKNEGHKPRWSQHDAYTLVHRVHALNVRDDTEIDWKTLSDPTWNLWSAHSLQRRWLTMKRSIKGYEDMTHQEIMEILRVKKAHQPVVSGANRRKKVTSAAAIAEAGDAPTAGSSTGPGTLAQADISPGVDDAVTGTSQDAEGSTDSSDSDSD